MKKYCLISILFRLLLFPVNQAIGQVDSTKFKGVKITVPSKEKKNNTYFILAGGYQNPSWYRVPMIPENHSNLTIKGNMNVKVPGWFAGFGFMKKTRTPFEVGLLVDFYKTSIPVAYSGQNSTSDWLMMVQSGNPNYLSANDIDRISEVYSFKASIRYKISLAKTQFWCGLAPGTFSSKVWFKEINNNEPAATYRETSLGLTYQAGINFLIKNSKGKDIFSFTFFSDFSSPKIEEKMISLFEPGWKFMNSEGNYAINPVRLGFAIGIH
jgi:hypothetical protein